MTYEIEMKNVTVTYEDTEKPALNEINLRVRRGDIIVVMGPTGAGKTTFCRLLNGLIPHHYRCEMKGQVMVAGFDTKKYSIPILSRSVGILYDEPSSQLIAPTVEDELAFGLENYGVLRDEMVRRVNHFIRACRLEGYEKRNPHSLSGGEQQACALAAIMAMYPRVYVLDEPTSHLDPIGSHMVYSLIKEVAKIKDRTILIADNRIEEVVSIADRIVVVDNGRIVLDGDPRTILNHAEKLANAGIRLPQVSELLNQLKKVGFEFEEMPATLAEAHKILSAHLKSKRKVDSSKGKEADRTIPPKKPIIETKDLWHIYQPVGTTALKGVNLKIYNGEFVAIIGQNGSGKSTLVRHFNGLLKPTRGKIYVYGKDATTLNTAELSRDIGVVFQNPDHQIFSSTVKKELELGPKNLGVPIEDLEKRSRNALEAVRLGWDILNKNPMDLTRAMRRRLNIASVLTMRPKTLIVDEPTTGQDPRMCKELMDLLKQLHEKHINIIVITHEMDLAAEYADRCVVMKKGTIVLDGTPKEVFSKPQILEETYLNPPQITRLGQQLKDYGVPGNILTVDEMYTFLQAR